MPEPGVTNIDGREFDGWHHLVWREADGLHSFAFTADMISSLRAYIAQPGLWVALLTYLDKTQDRTPREVAEKIVTDWAEQHKVSLGRPAHRTLVDLVADALTAERKRGEGTNE